MAIETNFERNVRMSELREELDPDTVCMYCETCNEEYNLPEETEFCPICGNEIEEC